MCVCVCVCFKNILKSSKYLLIWLTKYDVGFNERFMSFLICFKSFCIVWDISELIDVKRFKQSGEEKKYIIIINFIAI